MYLDQTCAEKVKNAHAAGLKVHLYHFARFLDNSALAKKEAEFAIKRAKTVSAPASCYLTLDYEEAKGEKEKNTAAVVVFLKEVKAAGFRPMFYSYFGMRSLFDIGKIRAEVSGVVFWLANYGTEPGMDIVDVLQYTNNYHKTGADGDNYFHDKLI
jgi:GH25 family lysozyme M1 (1,4-beta-N-acetylmuramidase)